MRRTAFIVRLPLSEHRKIKRAARMRGKTVTEFARNALAIEVRAATEEQEHQAVTRAALG